MNKKNMTANTDILQILLDCSAIYMAYWITNLICYKMAGYFPDSKGLWLYFTFTTIFFLSMYMLRMYNITTFYYVNRIIKYSLFSAGIAGLCISALVFLTDSLDPGRVYSLTFFASGLSAVIVERMVRKWSLRSNIGNGYTHILFIGDNSTKEQYIEYINKTMMKVKVDWPLGYSDFQISSLAEFEKMLKSINIDEVVFVYGTEHNSVNIKEHMSICEDMGITVRLVLDLIDLPISQRFVCSVGTYPVLTYHSVSFDKVSLFIKDVIDMAGAVLGLLLFSPVFLVTAVAIKVESPGPIFYKQIRIGRNGKPFKMYKFRSMYRDADERKRDLMGQNKIKDGLMFKLDNDPRITRVGKFIRKTSIDELPQLINVLMHNMSLVGTRPPTPEEVGRYNRDHWRRISIKPGITGLWQISGRSDIVDFDEVVALDKKYIDQWSLAMDIKILLMTVLVVFSQRGAV